jgi:hypothetical protein
MRNSTCFFIFSGALTLIFVSLLTIHPARTAPQVKEALEKKKEIVEKLGLTDICLFTEARYTRHVTQADLFSPFQDHPAAREHYPSGSLIRPPFHSGPYFQAR